MRKPSLVQGWVIQGPEITYGVWKSKKKVSGRGWCWRRLSDYSPLSHFMFFFIVCGCVCCAACFACKKRKKPHAIFFACKTVQVRTDIAVLLFLLLRFLLPFDSVDDMITFPAFFLFATTFRGVAVKAAGVQCSRSGG